MKSSAILLPSGCSGYQGPSMEFAFTDDQLTLTQAAREMLVDSCQPADLRRLLESQKPRDDAR